MQSGVMLPTVVLTNLDTKLRCFEYPIISLNIRSIPSSINCRWTLSELPGIYVYLASGAFGNLDTLLGLSGLLAQDVWYDAGTKANY